MAEGKKININAISEITAFVLVLAIPLSSVLFGATDKGGQTLPATESGLRVEKDGSIAPTGVDIYLQNPGGGLQNAPQTIDPVLKPGDKRTDDDTHDLQQNQGQSTLNN